MLYSDQSLSLQMHDGGIAELCFDLANESVNKFDSATVISLSKAIDVLVDTPDIKGLLVTSAKPVFIVGADITEFIPMFTQAGDAVSKALSTNSVNFRRLEDLPFPTCAVINGYALGGGFELCLACDYRVMSSVAKVGLPEIKLGLLPGWGGTVRLPRVIGIDESLMWIAAAGEQRPQEALRVGAVDAVASPEQLRDIALATLQNAISGDLDYCARRVAKHAPLPINTVEATMAFMTAKALVAQQAGPNMVAPVEAVNTIEKAVTKNYEEAIALEAKAFAKLVTTPQARALVGLFLSDQLLGKKSKKWSKASTGELNRAAVLGAGIMGGGIAYQSALKGTPIRMKDIAQAGLDLGMSEASKLLSKRVAKGRMKPEEMAAVLTAIQPTLNYEGFDSVDVCVEAVVENAKVKHAVLAEAEKHLSADAILASNTSTISITHLAQALQRPENFAGMHFFNPVHAMPLVEVIRGEKTSDATVAKLVAYASKMGKKPVVVRDCPGFLVNRVLFPYFGGFSGLMRDGADFQKIDKVMEKWGWPMGPAYLMDVVGIDTGVHAANVMAEGFPDRMTYDYKPVSEVMFENNRLGQKNGIGFYEYSKDKRGRPQKVVNEVVYTLIAPHVGERREFIESEIVARMMVPMAIELARCLEEGIVESAAEADIALIYGLGFPTFRGGVFQWIDTMGVAKFVEMADQYADLGAAFQVTDGMRSMAANNKSYYGI
ncbi:MAG TPA: fatty acid oxidation complex subunit alpha FadB [Pseudomonadales bacterium]|nr:fatty acid oxidation complex subunit alpha FadB [Pseudomonadales bacterium]